MTIAETKSDLRKAISSLHEQLMTARLRQNRAHADYDAATSNVNRLRKALLALREQLIEVEKENPANER